MSRPGSISNEAPVCKPDLFPVDAPAGGASDTIGSGGRPGSAPGVRTRQREGGGERGRRSGRRGEGARPGEDRYEEPRRRTRVTTQITRLGRCTRGQASLVPLEQGAEKPLGFYAEGARCDGGHLQAELGGVRQVWKDGARLEALTQRFAVGPDGRSVDLTMFAGNTGREGTINGEGEVFKAGARARWDDNGASLGAVASAVGGAVRLGKLSKERGDDEQVRLGLSVSKGAAGRLHWGDEDGDGRPEYGVGADIGAVSFDLKTEVPLQTAARLALGEPVWQGLMNGMRILGRR